MKKKWVSSKTITNVPAWESPKMPKRKKGFSVRDFRPKILEADQN